MDIGKYITDSWNIYIKNFFSILISLIIVGILSVCTIGILAVPLSMGFMMMFVKVKRGQEIQVNDVFAYINKFLPLLLGAIVLYIIIIIGFILIIIPGLIFAAWWMYTFLYMVDKNMGFGDAMKASKQLVSSKGILMHILFLIVCGFIGGIGSAIFGIGQLLTLPIGLGALALAYEDESKGEAPASQPQ